MRDFYIAPPARRILGPAGVAQACAQSLTGWRCAVCAAPFDGAEPVSVQVAYNAKRVDVDYTHPRCSKSRAQQLPDDAPAPMDPSTPLDIRIAAAVLTHDGRSEAALAAEIQAQLFRQHDSGDLTDALVAEMLGAGFELVTDPGLPVTGRARWLAATPAGPARTVGGNAVHDLGIVDHNSALFFTGSIAVPDGWLTTALGSGECVLYYGITGLFDDPRATGAYMPRLVAAAAAGRLVAARIPIRELPAAADLVALEAVRS